MEAIRGDISMWDEIKVVLNQRSNDLMKLISLQIFQATYFNDNIQRLADFVALFCIAIFLLSAFKNFYNK